MYQTPHNCPACKNVLEITELTCPQCGVTIRGRFPLEPFMNLDAESITFLKIFLKHRGNITETARALDISHPTARLKLNAVLARMGLGDERLDNECRVETVLDNLYEGSISVQDAIKKLDRKEKRS